MPEDGTITFVPSVHFSPTHRRRVRETIREERPDLVAVELDERRFERLDRGARADPSDVAADLPPPTAVAYATLKAIQRSVVRLYGLDPSRTDMEAGVETAAEQDIEVALVDDPIAETMAALAARVNPLTVTRTLMRAGTMEPGDPAEGFQDLLGSFDEVDSGDDVQPAIDRMRRLAPGVTEVLIDRRDRAMAERLHALRREGRDVVAVVGAGHHNGIRRVLADLDAADADPDVEVPVRASSRTVTRIPVE